MNPESQSPHEVINPEWQELMRVGIEDTIANFELLYQPSRDEVYSPFTLSPVTISEEMDEREYVELTESERAYLKKQLFEQLGVSGEPEVVEEYKMPSANPDEEEERVRVIKTERAEEGLYIHEIFRQGITEYMVAAQDYRL